MNNENDGDSLLFMICPDCETLVPASNLELHRLRSCPANCGRNVGRRHGSAMSAVNLATTTNVSTPPVENHNSTNEDEDDGSVVVVMTTMADSSSRRPRKTRRGDGNSTEDAAIQSSSSPFPMEIDSGSNIDGTANDVGNGNGNGNRNSNSNSNSNRNNNDEDEIINLMDESDMSSEPLLGVAAPGSVASNGSARAVDLSGNDDEEGDGEDRKLPARDAPADSSPSNSNSESNNNNDDDDDNQGDDEWWPCPRCTLLNKFTTSRCDACQYFNREVQSQLNQNRYTSQQDHTTLGQSSQRREQRPVSASSSMGYIGSGALLGAAVGMAGNWVQGRDPLSGAFEGGTTGAMGGALLHEVLQPNNTNNNSNNDRDSDTASTTAQAGTATTNLERNQNVTEPTSSLRFSHFAEEGGSLRTTSSNSSNYSNVARARSSVSTGGAGSRSEFTANESMNTNSSVRMSSSASRPYPRVEEDYVRVVNARREAMMNLLLRHQLRMYDNRDRASYGGIERANSGDAPNIHQVLLRQRQLETMHLHRAFRSLGGSGNTGIDAMNYEQLLNAFGDGTENMGADESEIRRLPSHIVGDNPLPEDARQCLICLEDFEKGESRTILPCLHGFHQNCCHKWLKTNGKCPVCKHPITSNG